MSTYSQTALEKTLQNEDNSTEVQQIAKDISDKIYDISNFVEQLGFALTDPSVEIRVNGTRLLTEVLNQLPKDFLNDQQLQYLSAFYADRLKDHHNVIPIIIDAIDALIHMKHMPAESVTILLRSFFQNTTCQSQMRSDRSKLFYIFKYLTERYEKELISMAGDFIYGLINSIDGERDPRNLDFIFSFMPNVISRFPLLHLSEEMFEVFACYFPIDFNPSSNDPDTITREQLAKNLADCLVASTDFVEWAVSLALEKLESDLVVAKLDSLELLQQCALKYTPKNMESHFEQIWAVIKTNTLPGNDNKDIVAAGLSTLRIFLSRAAENSEVSQHNQTIVLGNILPHLNDINQRLFDPATAIALVCIAGDASFAGNKVLNSFLLKLTLETDSNNKPLTDEQRVKIYDILAQVYKVASLSDSKLQHVNGAISQELHKDIIATLRRSDDEFKVNLDLKRAALNILNESVPIISEAHRVIVYQILQQLITNETIDLDITELLEQLAALYPIEIQSNCLDICIQNFPTYSNIVKAKIFRNLIMLVKQMAFSQRILDLIFSNIFSEDLPNDTRCIALEALKNLLLSEDGRFIEDLQHNSCLIDKLVNLLKLQSVWDLKSLLALAAVILSHIIQQLSIAEQYSIVSEYLPQLNIKGNPSDLYIANGLLSYLHEDISLDDYFEKLLGDLTAVSIDNNDTDLRTVANHLLCSLTNKIDYQQEGNRMAIAKLIAYLRTEIEKENPAAVEVLAWIAKALIVRGCQETVEVIEALTQLLDQNPAHISLGLLAFEIISSELQELHLPKIKYLYKQKLFHTVLHKFGDRLNSPKCDQYVEAFIFILKTTPHAVLKMNINKIGTILFKSLESNKINTLRISLNICKDFIKDKDDYFRTHLHHIITSCLKLAQFKLSMQVRIDSLNLLRDITDYPTFALLPHKMDVVLDLAVPLDDPKRLVRNAAVITRNTWCLLGAPNSADN